MHIYIYIICILKCIYQYIITKGLENTQHLMLLQVLCVSSNHQAFV